MAKKKSLLKKLIHLFLFCTVVFVAFHFIYPDVSRLKKENPKKSAFMEYREAEWAREGKKYRIRQIWVPYGAISPYLIKAVLIGEDDKFWQHEGFDYEAMQKAIEKDIKAKKFKLGGSTISQQLAKNLFLSPSKNPVRKIREAIITWRMERALPKKRLLELYLNVAEWGDAGIFGIEAASRHYYGKSASALGPEEASRLAAVLPNPRKFNPLGSSRYVVNRSALIYNIMVRRGIVVPELDEVEQKSPEVSEEKGAPPVSPVEATKSSSQ
ncbi:MAG: monofunctional biosynthetic peptidoglycan transglycosylase [Nitrospirae bacterium]|nr:monofunctional biosynthetic peptidoglycan transglycosylase [Nitrospirota bacterium]